MAIFNKFDSFIEADFEKKHDFSSDTFKVMLTNTAPIATNSVKADLPEIASGNGYIAGGNSMAISSSSQTSGVYTATVSGDVVFTATGNIPAFRYAVVYNSTSANDDLVCWWDYGSSISMIDTETFTLNTDGVNLITAS